MQKKKNAGRSERKRRWLREAFEMLHLIADEEARAEAKGSAHGP